MCQEAEADAVPRPDPLDFDGLKNPWSARSIRRTGSRRRADDDGPQHEEYRMPMDLRGVRSVPAVLSAGDGGVAHSTQAFKVRTSTEPFSQRLL
jgi:hypothetical protein